jgi:hypothetical protein
VVVGAVVDAVVVATVGSVLALGDEPDWRPDRTSSTAIVTAARNAAGAP